jgi:hypothetical protein
MGALVRANTSKDEEAKDAAIFDARFAYTLISAKVMVTL